MKTRKKKLKGAAPTKPRKAPGRQRQRLIDACISALHIHGPSRTTVAKVVAIAKMSPGIVRFYFDSKAAMLVASLKYLAAEFDDQVLLRVAACKSRPVAALELLVDLYLDPELASARKVSVWYAFWGEASSRQEYYDICGQKDESFAALVRELVERLIVDTAQAHLDPDGVALGLIGVLEILWQDFAFRSERDIDRAAARKRCMAYLRSVFPGHFTDDAGGGDVGLPDASGAAPLAGWTYEHPGLHGLERERWFRGTWAVVGHESQISRAGEFLAADTGAERVLVVRDSANGLHAWRNACPRAPHALTAGGRGRFDGVIACRRHGLIFSFDGRRRDGSGAGDLAALQLASVGGLLFAGSPVGQHPAVARPTPACWAGSEVPAGLSAPAHARHLPVAADWKVVVEQWLESFALDARADADTVRETAVHGGSGWSAERYRSLLGDRSPQARWRRHFVAPNHLFEMRPDGLSVLQAIPVAAGRCMVRRLDFSVLAADRAARAALYLACRLGAHTRREARDMAESTQRGMKEFGYARAPGGAVPFAVAWFRRRVKRAVPQLARARPPPV